MQFEKDANLVNLNGEKVGEIDRVVINPSGGEVTHVVVRKGFLFPEDKVIPVDMISPGEEGNLRIMQNLDDLDRFPDYIETHYVPLEGDDREISRWNYPSSAAAPVYWYPMIGAAPLMWTGGATGYYPPEADMPVSVEENIPDGTIALKEGAKVVDTTGESLGDVEKIITSKEDNRITHLVVTKGMFDQKKKLIPANWINAIKEDGVRLSVNAGFVDRLKDYED